MPLMKLMKESLEKESNKQNNSLKKLKDSYNKITKFKGTYKVKITFKENKNYKNAGKTIKIKVKG